MAANERRVVGRFGAAKTANLGRPVIEHELNREKAPTTKSIARQIELGLKNGIYVSMYACDVDVARDLNTSHRQTPDPQTKLLTYKATRGLAVDVSRLLVRHARICPGAPHRDLIADIRHDEQNYARGFHYPLDPKTTRPCMHASMCDARRARCDLIVPIQHQLNARE